MKILIIKFRHLGDVLLTTPLISNLKRIYNAEIHFALYSGCEEMIEGNPNVKKIHALKKSKGNLISKINHELKFAKTIRDEKFDMVVQTTTGDRGLYIAIFSGAKTIVAPRGEHFYLNYFITNVVNISKMHAVDRELSALSALKTQPIDKKVEIFFDKNALDGFNLPDIFIHIHPVSRWMFKCINENIVAKIIDFIEFELKIKVIITASKDNIETQYIQNIIALCKSSPINLTGMLNLKQIAALSARAKLFIGCDTGIMHIAACSKTPVISFFGPSVAFYWGPWDNSCLQSNYVLKNGTQRMGKNTVFQSCYDCVPCDKAGCGNSKLSVCLNDFDFDEIKSEIIKKLS